MKSSMLGIFFIFSIVTKAQQYGSFTDARDGRKYKTVKIGTQVWMAENLNFASAQGSKCYENSNDYCRIYGRLYVWDDAYQVCPQGWVLPSDKDWSALVNYLGGSKVAGKKLKSKSGWYKGGNGTNAVGFNALPGSTEGDGTTDCFLNKYMGSCGFWWTASVEDPYDETALYREMRNEHSGVKRYLAEKANMFSVRCIKGELNLNNFNRTFFPTEPLYVFYLFKKSVISEDFESLRALIHSDGAFLMGEERVKKDDFVKTTFLKRNLLNQLKKLLTDGKVSLNDNFDPAQGNRGTSSTNPHLDFENREKNGGQFKKGSKIVTVYHNYDNPEQSYALVIELYKDYNDGDSWRIYSIYRWVFDIE